MSNTLKLGNGNWATKKESLLAYNSENNNFKPLPFNFTRNSSATRVNKAGLIETVGSGEPRIDFKDNTKGALLLEPSRSNLFTYSEYFIQDWFSGGGGAFTITPNAVISPDGTQNASKLIALGVGYQLRQNKAIINTQMSNSFYMRTNQGTRQMSIRINDNEITETFIVTSEWKRYTVSGLVGGTLNGSGRCSLNNVDILDENNHVYIWGAQLEQGSYATSYIPTQGSIGTRVQDACYNDNLGNVIGQTEGTFYLETVPLSSTTSFTERIMQFESSGSDFITFQRYANSNLTFFGTDGSNNWTIQGLNLFVGGETIKIAGAYKDNDIVLYVNGVQIGTNNTVNAPQVDRMWFANNSSGSLAYSGSNKEVKIYNTRLSNTELQALTTI